MSEHRCILCPVSLHSLVRSCVLLLYDLLTFCLLCFIVFLKEEPQIFFLQCGGTNRWKEERLDQSVCCSFKIKALWHLLWSHLEGVLHRRLHVCVWIYWNMIKRRNQSLTHACCLAFSAAVDGDSKWSVRYTSQKPKQGVLFLPGKRRPGGAEDLQGQRSTENGITCRPAASNTRHSTKRGFIHCWK